MGVELLAAGALISAYGTISRSNSEADSARARAANLNVQAQETLRRARINDIAITEQGNQFIGTQESAMAKGHASLSGSNLTRLIATKAEIQRKLFNNDQEANFEVSQDQAGANSLKDYATQTQQNGAISAFGGILMSGASYGLKSGAFTSDYKMGITEIPPDGGGLGSMGYSSLNGSYVGNNYKF